MTLPGWLWPPWWPGGVGRIEKGRYDAMTASLTHAASDGSLGEQYTIAEASLKSVVDLTGYEDNKVARLLTVAAFLSAIVGAVFTRFSTLYLWADAAISARTAYVAFFIYLILVVCAATILIGSIRPTFNLKWTATTVPEPRSLFFYKEILRVGPDDWANAFIDNKHLKARATADFVAETYFVSEKIAKKLWWVKRGIYLLVTAMIALVVFFVSTAATFLAAAPSATPPTVTVSQSPAPSRTATGVTAPPHVASKGSLPAVPNKAP